MKINSPDIYRRFALPSDAVQIAEIEKECFSEPWSDKAVTEFLSFDFNRILCAFDGELLCGYISFSTVCGECSIGNVAVRQKLRNMGIASGLLLDFKQFLKDNFVQTAVLEVRESNTPAINLYKKHGFSVCGIRKGFYSHPKENAVIMNTHLF